MLVETWLVSFCVYITAFLFFLFFTITFCGFYFFVISLHFGKTISKYSRSVTSPKKRSTEGRKGKEDRLAKVCKMVAVSVNSLRGIYKVCRTCIVLLYKNYTTKKERKDKLLTSITGYSLIWKKICNSKGTELFKSLHGVYCNN